MVCCVGGGWCEGVLCVVWVGAVCSVCVRFFLGGCAVCGVRGGCVQFVAGRLMM